MNHRVLIASLFVSAGVSAGCNGPVSPSGPVVVADGPHGGAVVPLPGDAGFAEIFNEEAAAPDSRRRGRVPKSVVVYFLGPDKKTALSPAPTGVGVKILGGDTGATITLGPAPEPKDPAGASRFASPVGDFDLSGRRAELTADLGGQKVVREFQGLR